MDYLATLYIWFFAVFLIKNHVLAHLKISFHLKQQICSFFLTSPILMHTSWYDTMLTETHKYYSNVQITLKLSFFFIFILFLWAILSREIIKPYKNAIIHFYILLVCPPPKPSVRLKKCCV